MDKKNKNILIVVGIIIVLGYFYINGRNAATDTVGRAISKTTGIQRGEEITVTYTYAGNEPFFTIEEKLPTGWTYAPSTSLNGVVGSSYVTGGITYVRIVSSNTGTDAAPIVTKVIPIRLTAPSTGAGGNQVFNGGKFWSVNNLVTTDINSVTIVMVGCTPKSIDTSKNCIVESTEWATWINSQWLTGLDSFTSMIDFGNIYWVNHVSTCGSLKCYSN